MPEIPSRVVQQTRPVGSPPEPSPRWVDALCTLLGSLGPHRWEDVEDAVDHVLVGRPEAPPTFTGGRSLERNLSGYEAANRMVLAGLAEVPVEVGLRWVRLRAAMRGPVVHTMTPLAGGMFEGLLEDLADAFGAPSRRVPLNVSVLEEMSVRLGMSAASVVLSAWQPGPEAPDPQPSRACLTLTAMRGYDEALLRHATQLRLHLLGFDTVPQIRAAKMLERAATPTLRVYADVIDTMSESRSPEVRVAARTLQQRLDASRPGLSVEPPAQRNLSRASPVVRTIPEPRPGG